jgi:hypothetical protein
MTAATVFGRIQLFSVESSKQTDHEWPDAKAAVPGVEP